jgi:hypothetical protein
MAAKRLLAVSLKNMNKPATQEFTPCADEDFLAGGGETGALARAFDWSQTPAGPPASWPQSLRTAVGMILQARSAMYLAWGGEFVQFHNDAYRPLLGASWRPALGR